MMHWKFSHYSVAFPSRDGEILLCNSFMGALTRVSATEAAGVAKAIKTGIPEKEPPSTVLRELCRHGFFVETDLDEQDLVGRIIERERDDVGFSMILMPHENCNFRCVYCYESFARDRMNPEIAEGVKRFVAKNASQWGHFGVAWFGGEPLLARDLVYELSDSFMASCSTAGIAYRSGITTNAYHLTATVAQALLERNVRLFQITVDGPQEEHDKRRHLLGGQGTYRRVLDNLTQLRGLTGDFTVRLRVNFDPQSVIAIESWLGDIAPLFAGDERFHLDFQAIGKWGGPNDGELNVCEGGNASASKLKLYEAAIGHDFSMGSIKGFLSSHGAACYAGKKSSIVVGADGALYKCTVAFDDPRNKIGRITAEGELIVDPKLWNMWVGTEDKNIVKCGSCWFNASCQSRACPLVAMDDKKGEPPCPSTPSEIAAYLQLAVYGNRLETASPASAG